MRSLTTPCAVVAVAALASACLIHKPTEKPAPPVEVPAGFSAAGGGQAPGHWWAAFGDPQLNALVTTALGGNFQLRASWARLRQASALARQAGSLRWPQLNASVGAQRSKNRFDFGEQVIEPTVNQFSASVSVSYEVDVWRKADSGTRAAVLDARATRDDYEAAAISVAAEVAEAWFDLVVQRERRVLLEQQLTTSETFLELVTLRFREGLASAADVYQQRQQAANVRAQLALIDAFEQVNANRLAVLLGVNPGSVSLSDRQQLPELPALPAAGVPADLLLNRPDLRSLQRRVEAADWRIAVAVADRLPRFSLSGSTGTQASTVGDLFATPLWTIAANLFAPLFDGWRRKAEVERTRGVMDELIAVYGQSVLVALAEVENALASERQQLIHIEALAESVELGRQALREAQARYREGLTDFLPVLTALTTVQRGELELLTARRQALSYRVQLCRALGGAWTSELAGPGERAPTRQGESS